MYTVSLNAFLIIDIAAELAIKYRFRILLIFRVNDVGRTIFTLCTIM